MKKWILLGVLVVFLVAAIIVVNKLTEPDNGGATIGPVVTTTEETYCEADMLLMETTWEEYQAMTVEEQETFKNSFTDLQVYIDWYWMAKGEYDAQQNVQVIGPGQSIDVSDLVNSAK